MIRHIAIASLLLALASTAGLACDTPVYRYAMYRWAPAPYEIYYFHDEPASEADLKTHEAINQLVDRHAPRTNVAFVPVDLNDDAELNKIPPDVKRAWQAKEDPSLPTYVIASPLGMELFSGKLTVDDVEAVANSPARKKICGDLGKGGTGAFVLLEGVDPQANKQAEDVVAKVVDQVASGDIDLFTAPTGAPPADAAEPPKPKSKTSLIKVSRDDPKEKWLVRSLLAVESDLKDFDEPMVFVIYGRGRALPPYIGAGINYENLLNAVHFITGACSCTVKEQNPGVDLLATYDWEAASETLMNMFGVEEGNEDQASNLDLFPQLIIPGEAVVKSDAAAAELDEEEEASLEANEAVASADEPAGDEVVVANEVESEPPAKEAKENEPEVEAPTLTPDDAEVAMASVEAPSSGEARGERGLLATIGLIMTAAFCVLLAATYFILRPR